MSTPSSSGLPSFNISGKSSYLWVLDSGASHHLSPSSSSFVSTSHSHSSMSGMTIDGTPMSLVGVGFVCTSHLSLSNVYRIPKLIMDLIFMSQLCDFDYSINFSYTSCHVQDAQSQRLIG